MKKQKPLRFSEVIPDMKRGYDELKAEVVRWEIEEFRTGHPVNRASGTVTNHGESFQRLWVFNDRYQKNYIFPLDIIYVVREKPADESLRQPNWSHPRFWKAKHPPVHAILVVEETSCTSQSANTALA